jgi:hypothetical protein
MPWPRHAALKGGNMPQMASHAPIGYLVVLILIAPAAFMLGRLHKRQRGEDFTRKQRWTRLAIASVVFLILMVIAGLASADQKPPVLASVAGAWTFTQKETALPFGPLCTNSAVIRGRHVTLKVTGARMFEATLAITKPQHKRGNVLNVYVDDTLVENAPLQYGQNPYALRISLPPGAQTLTLMEERYFPKVSFCNIKLS